MKTIRQLLLWPFAKGFELIARLYHKLWDRGVFQSQKAPIPVVSIGNLAIGGVGKTPLTIFLAEQLARKNIQVAIASRGYQSEWENSPIAKRVDPGKTQAIECGDEPLLMAKKCPNVSVWITKHRIKSAIRAAQEGAQLLLLDDGMQHRKIAKNFEIALLDGKDPFGGGAFFPLGKLRDHPSRLKKVTLIALMNCKDEKLYRNSKKLIGEYSSAPVVGFGATIDLPQLKKIAVLTAIADPKRFLDLLKEKGVEIVLQSTLRDHSFFKEKMIEDFVSQALNAGAEAIICTEKDHVKIGSALKSSLPIVPIPLQIFPVFDQENWEEALDQIRRLLES